MRGADGTWKEFPVTWPAEEVTPKVDSRFPHTCPKCKRPCYIGLNTIEHQDRDSACH